MVNFAANYLLMAPPGHAGATVATLRNWLESHNPLAENWSSRDYAILNSAKLYFTESHSKLLVHENK